MIRIPNIGRAVKKILPVARAIDESSFLDRATILRQGAATIGTQGGRTNVAETTTDVPCRLRPIGNGVESEIAGRFSLVNPAAIDFVYNQPLDEEAQVVIGTQTFNVRSVLPQGATAVKKTAICDEVK